MLVQTERTLALRCSACGRLQPQSFSLFDLSDRRPRSIECMCGLEKALFERRGRSIRVQVKCLVCDAPHVYHFPAQQLWRERLTPFLCQDTGVELGYIGETESVKAAIANQDVLENLVFDPECKDYFVNPQVMHDTLATVQAIAEVGRLGCACGNTRIELDIYPEKIELICPACGSTVVLYAESKDDLQLTAGLRGLTLPTYERQHEDSRPSSHQTRG